MKNFLSRKKKDEFTIYISGRGFDEQESYSIEPLVEVEQIRTMDFDEETGEFIFPPKPGPDEDPNYYVHPKYWYKRFPGECGQGYRYAMEGYYENLAERRQARLAKLKTKLPVLGLVATIGIIGGVAWKHVFK